MEREGYWGLYTDPLSYIVRLCKASTKTRIPTIKLDPVVTNSATARFVSPVTRQPPPLWYATTSVLVFQPNSFYLKSSLTKLLYFFLLTKLCFVDTFCVLTATTFPNLTSYYGSLLLLRRTLDLHLLQNPCCLIIDAFLLLVWSVVFIDVSESTF